MTNLKLYRKLPIERTLGVQWCVYSESTIPCKTKGSTINQTRHPFHCKFYLWSPSISCILIGRRILQQLRRDGADWYDPIGDGIRSRCEKWRLEICLLAELKILRCYKPSDFGSVSWSFPLLYSHASLVALGQCSYLDLKNDQGNICTSLVIAKAKVAHAKPAFWSMDAAALI